MLGAAFQLHVAVAALEQEKFEMQKKHTENIQELLEDTNSRLAKMEAEYSARSQATVSTATADRICVYYALKDRTSTGGPVTPSGP